jgi:Four helix bundle sensory module for signal transduction
MRRVPLSSLSPFACMHLHARQRWALVAGAVPRLWTGVLNRTSPERVRRTPGAGLSGRAPGLDDDARRLCGDRAFTGVLGWYAATAMERLNEGTRTMSVDVFGGTHLLATWLDRSWESRSDLLPYLLAQDAAQRARLRTNMATIDQELSEVARRMDDADTDREDVQTLAGLMQAWQAYDDWRHQAVIGAVEAGDQSAAMHAYDSEGVQRLVALDDAIEAFLAKKREVGLKLAANAEATYDSTRALAILLSVGAAGFGLLSGFFLSGNIAGAVGQVARAAKGARHRRPRPAH